MVRVSVEAFQVCLPLLTDMLVGRQAAQRLEPSGEVVGYREVVGHRNVSGVASSDRASRRDPASQWHLSMSGSSVRPDHWFTGD